MPLGVYHYGKSFPNFFSVVLVRGGRIGALRGFHCTGFWYGLIGKVVDNSSTVRVVGVSPLPLNLTPVLFRRY